MQPALAMHQFVEYFFGRSYLYAALIIGHALRVNVVVAALPIRSWTIFRDAVVGSRAVSLYFFLLLSFGDDHTAGVPPNVNDIVEVIVGVVIVVALLLLMASSYALASQGSLLVANSMTLVEIVHHKLVFQLDGDRHSWWS